MTHVAYVDAVGGGAAGDMLLAALLDAGAPIATVQEAVEAVLPGRFSLSAESVRRGDLRALRLRASAGEPSEGRRTFLEMMRLVEGSTLPDGIRDTVRAILTHLGQAEARVHGIDLADLEVHELGDDDTLLDVVGVTAGLDALGVTRVFVSPLPLGAGATLKGPHGMLPLPAPVTLELLRGFHVVGALEGEWVTPTAAAILAATGLPAREVPPMVLARTGCGAGSRDVAGRPNIVRILLGHAVEGQGVSERELVVLETNLDDLSPELVADAAAALRAAGALDVWTTAVQMKKGRSGVVLSALAEPAAAAALRTAFFESTSTFGVRSHTVRRVELERRTVAVAVDSGTVRVKVGMLQGRVVSAKPEHDDVAQLAQRAGRPEIGRAHV